jgi:hypothetical protein
VLDNAGAFSSSEVAPLEEKRSRYKSPGWLRAKERIGQLVRENYVVDKEMSPRLAALVKKIENGSFELSMDAKREAEGH